MTGYSQLYNQVEADFRQSSKSGKFWSMDSAITGRFFFRPLGFLLAPLFIKLSFSANQVTYLSFLVGTLGNVLFALGDPRFFVAAATCYVGFAILDFVDGPVARHHKTNSYFGKLVDSSSGLLVSSFVPICVGFGVARSGTLPEWIDSPRVYIFLAALSVIVNLVGKQISSNFSLQQAKLRSLPSERTDDGPPTHRTASYILRRAMFHAISNTAHLGLLILTMVGLTYLFPLLLLPLAALQFLLTLLKVSRSGAVLLRVEER